MKKGMSVLILSLFLSGITLSNIALADSSTSLTTTVSGHVTYLGKSAPNVRVVAQGGCPYQVGYTDSNGDYSIKFSPNYGCTSPVTMHVEAYYGRFAGGGNIIVDQSNNALLDIDIIQDAIVSGRVTYEGVPISNANPIITCNGSVMGSTTNSSGGYNNDQFAPSTGCTPGSPVTVNVKWNGIDGSSSGSIDNTDNAMIDVALPPTEGVNPPNVTSLPEMGAYEAVGALLIGGCTVFLVRRRQLLSL